MPELVRPASRFRTTWLACRDEQGAGVREDDVGLRPGDEVRAPDGSADRVTLLRRQAEPARVVERVGGELEGVRSNEQGRVWRSWWTCPRGCGCSSAWSLECPMRR